MKKTTDDLLEDIKRLLILNLIKNDVKAIEVAKTLAVDPAIISRIISGKK